ncbi:MAG: DUF935 family protein [Agriterribacter sp.]
MSDSNIKKEPGEKQAIVLNSLNIISVDRTAKDIRSWREAHRNAEAVSYPNRTKLYDLYKDVELDGHLSGITQKRFDSVLNKRIFFEEDEDKKESIKAENTSKKNTQKKSVDLLIKHPAFRNLLRLMLEQITWGLSGAEFIPGDDLKFLSIPRKHIKPYWRIIAKEQSGQEGYKYDDMWNVCVWGDNDDLGLYLKAAPYALWKKGGFADWAQYVEIFGQPTRVAKYDTYDSKTRMELEKALNESGSSLAMMIPKQVDFEMMDGKTSNGTGDLQEKFTSACNREMSIIVLGNTETTSASTSSGYAQAKEHGKQQLEITKSDITFIENALNDEKLIKIFQSYGYEISNGRFVFETENDVAELSQKKDVDLAISAKVPIDDDYWYETYGIPKPDNYDELKAKMEAERLMKLMPPDDSEYPPNKPKPEGRAANLSAWRSIRQTLADFFDPAP